MRKKIVIGVIVVLAIGVIAFLILRPKASANQNWVTEDAKMGPITLSVSASGNINPENIYNVNTRVASKILEVNVNMGDTVKAGQQLAKLDDTDLQNALKTAQYNLNSAIYARDQVKSAPIVDNNNVKKAQQQVNSASVQVTSAKNNLNNAFIYSPIDGKVLAVNVKVGDYGSMASVTPAFIVGSSSNLQAYLNVNEVDIAKVKLGQDVTLTVDDVGRSIPGKVISIDENSTNITGIVYYRVKASLSDQTDLKPGMSVDSDVVITSKASVLTISSSAIQVSGGNNIVHILATDNTSANPTALTQEVQIGINNNTIAEVLSGLTAGQKIIINYNLKASSNSTISLPGTSTGQ